MDGVEASGPADVWPVLLALAVLAERPHGLGELGVVGDQRSGIPHRAEVLGRIEAERPRPPRRPGTRGLAGCAVCLAGVLDKLEVAVPSEGGQSLHVRQSAVQVHGQERLRARADAAAAAAASIPSASETSTGTGGHPPGLPLRRSPQRSLPARAPRPAPSRDRPARAAARRARSRPRCSESSRSTRRTPPRTPPLAGRS